MGRDVASKNTGFECFDVSAYIRLRGNQVPLEHFALWVFVSVGHDYLPIVRFDLWKLVTRGFSKTYIVPYHQKCFAKCSATLAKNVVGIQRDNITEGKYERMDIFHVKVVSSDGIRN
jgi:hypothetical protein